MADPGTRNGTFGSFDVERVARDDGRYLLYYSWHEPSESAADEAAAVDAPASREAWTPESGPQADV
ncbi:MAG: hypothetical protein ABR509_01365 [Candidatus Limnocylindria bacterium]